VSASRGRRKAVLFITHDLDEAIAMSDRVVVLSAGPRPRPSASSRSTCRGRVDVAEVRSDRASWNCTRASGRNCANEVLKGYAQQLVRAA
jgi:NitT/TauT family transport system ATP-binding protein